MPRGMVRLRIVPTWAHTVDEWTTPAGVRRLAPLGGELAAESLGVRELPGLESSETLVRQLSGQSAFQLNLGRSQAAASTRSVVTPLTLELGVTSRLTLGVTVPIVETRTRFGFALNNDTSSRFNSGVNPALTLASARAQNEALVRQLDAAAQRVQACLANGAATGCSGVAANPSAAQALLASLQGTSRNVGSLYGIDDATPGQSIVPVATSEVQKEIDRLLGVLSTQTAALLGSEFAIAGRPAGAFGPAGAASIAALYAAAGYDSLTESSRIGVGDVEIGAKLLVRDLPADASRGVRVALAGLVRLGTGEPALDSPYGEGTGDGQTDIEGAAIVDALLSRRVAVTVGGRFTVQNGTTESWMRDAAGVRDVFSSTRALVSPGDVVSLAVTPRYRVASHFSIDAHWSLHHQGGGTYTPVPAEGSDVQAPATSPPATTLQRAWLGATYSTVERWRRREARLPLDVVVAHLESLTSSGGPALKTSYTQIQVRLYYPLFGR